MIGIFDSGAGGLTALKAIHKVLPSYDLIYFGDTARFPYGTQSPPTLSRYAEEDATFLMAKGAKLIVIACNSASAVAGEHLKKELKIPVFDVIGPAVAEAKRLTKNGRIGIIGTRATVNSGVYELLLKNNGGHYKVITRAAPLLVPLVEERWIKRPETRRIIRYYLRPLKDARVDTLILGCTHYPILQKQIEIVMGKKVKVINPAMAVAESLKKYLEENKTVDSTLGRSGKVIFFVSAEAKHFQKTAEWWLGERVEVEEAISY